VKAEAGRQQDHVQGKFKRKSPYQQTAWQPNIAMIRNEF
jgi:hypothetical protein